MDVICFYLSLYCHNTYHFLGGLATRVACPDNVLLEKVNIDDTSLVSGGFSFTILLGG